MRIGIIKKWITDTLVESTEFDDYVNTVLGKSLNYYRSSPITEAKEVYPYLTVFGVGKEDDRTSDDILSNVWNIPIAIGIEEADDPIVEANGVTVWDSSEKVELIETKMMEILGKEVRCGISGEDIHIASVNTFLTEIGEADDVEAQTFITFGKYRDI